MPSSRLLQASSSSPSGITLRVDTGILIPIFPSVIVHSYIIRGLFGSAVYHISIEIAAFTVSIAQLSWLFIGVPLMVAGQGVLSG